MKKNKYNDSVQRISLSEYLGQNKQFLIPLYQRKFVWQKSNIEKFLEEIILLSNSLSNRDMFVGTIYLKYNDTKDSWEIIDGQQRTTFFYFIKAYFLTDKYRFSLNNLFKRWNEFIPSRTDKEQDKIKTDFVELRKTLENFNLESLNNEFETKYVNNKKTLNATLKLIDKIFEDYFIYELKDDIVDIYHFIFDFFERISLIEVKVRENDDINEIFTSINSKGKQLTPWDLIRNNLYRLARVENIDLMLAEIDAKFDYLLKQENKFNITPIDFIWAYTIFKYRSNITKPEIVDKFTKLFLDKKLTIAEFKDDVNTLYENLIKKSPYSETNNFQATFYILKELKAPQLLIPILYSLMAIKFNEEDFNKRFAFIKKMVANFVYYVIVMKKSSISFKAFFQNKSIINALIDWDIDKLVNSFSSSDFYEINTAPFMYDDNKRNYLLEDIVEKKQLLKFYFWLAGSNENLPEIFDYVYQDYKYLISNLTFENKEIKDVWTKLTPTELEAALNSIGNIVFKKNLIISNYSNDENKILFESENDKLLWTPDLISDRTRQIADLILRTIEINLI